MNSNILIISSEDHWITYAHMIDSSLKDLSIIKNNYSVGNIFVGKITSVIEKIASSFVEMENFKGFIRISDISTSKNPITNKPYVIKQGEKILVQIQQENNNVKAHKITTKINIVGRFFILLPNQKKFGISKSINQDQRSKLKSFILKQNLPKNMGIICRTSSTNANPQQMKNELVASISIWEKICDDFKNATSNKLIYENNDEMMNIIFKSIDKGAKKIVIDDENIKNNIDNTLKLFNIKNVKTVFYKSSIPLLKHYRVLGEIEKCINKRVWLPSGGHLIIDHTEAMTTIDVNSGKDVHREHNSSLEASILSINLEAAKIIPEQLHLRGIGGIIIIDFIDINNFSNQDTIIETLKHHMDNYSNKYSIMKMSKIGLVEMTRQRTKPSILQLMSSCCPYCHGCGFIKNLETSSIELKRKISMLFLKNNINIRIELHSDLLDFMTTNKTISSIINTAIKNNLTIEFISNDTLHLNNAIIYQNDKILDQITFNTCS